MLMKRPRKRACSTVPGLYRIGLRLVFSFSFLNVLLLFFSALVSGSRYELDFDWVSLDLYPIFHSTEVAFSAFGFRWISPSRSVGGGACCEHLFNCYRFRCGMIGDGEDG